MFTSIYGSRDATKDVDAVIRPSKIGKTLAAKVAAELGLPDDWLNDDVKQFLAEKEAKRSLPDMDFGKGIRIVVPTAAYLFAMKLRACRPPLPGYSGDYGDIRFLVEKMEITSVEEAETIHDDFFPHDRSQEKPGRSSEARLSPRHDHTPKILEGRCRAL